LDNSIAAILIRHGLELRREEILRLTQFAFSFTPEGFDGDDKIPLGASKLGGLPDLPKGCVWPMGKGQPLSFLCQINLSELTPLGGTNLFPKRGLLSFFYHVRQSTWGFSPDDKESWRVLFYDGEMDAICRLIFPLGVQETVQFEAYRIAFKKMVTLPPVKSAEVMSLGLSPEEHELYIRVLEELEEGRNHRLLGHPSQIQGNMKIECQMVSHGLNAGNASDYNDPRARLLASGAQDWILLLQLDSDGAPGMVWGDSGRLYFWIHNQDLDARDFDHVWAILQSF
jgi:uncharacterized protein YwqG